MTKRVLAALCLTACVRHLDPLIISDDQTSLSLDRDVAVRGLTPLHVVGSRPGQPVTLALGTSRFAFVAESAEQQAQGVLPADAPLGLQAIGLSAGAGSESQVNVLVLDGAPAITSVRTEAGASEGVAGDRLVIEGRGFDERSVANNLVRVAEQEIAVLSATSTRLVVQLPSDAHAPDDPAGTLGGVIALSVGPAALSDVRSEPAAFSLLAEPMLLALWPPAPVAGETVALFFSASESALLGAQGIGALSFSFGAKPLSELAVRPLAWFSGRPAGAQTVIEARLPDGQSDSVEGELRLTNGRRASSSPLAVGRSGDVLSSRSVVTLDETPLGRNVGADGDGMGALSHVRIQAGIGRIVHTQSVQNRVNVRSLPVSGGGAALLRASVIRGAGVASMNGTFSAYFGLFDLIFNDASFHRFLLRLDGPSEVHEVSSSGASTLVRFGTGRLAQISDELVDPTDMNSGRHLVVIDPESAAVLGTSASFGSSQGAPLVFENVAGLPNDVFYGVILTSQSLRFFRLVDNGASGVAFITSPSDVATSFQFRQESVQAVRVQTGASTWEYGLLGLTTRGASSGACAGGRDGRLLVARLALSSTGAVAAVAPKELAWPSSCSTTATAHSCIGGGSCVLTSKAHLSSARLALTSDAAFGSFGHHLVLLAPTYAASGPSAVTASLLLSSFSSLSALNALSEISAGATEIIDLPRSFEEGVNAVDTDPQALRASDDGAPAPALVLTDRTKAQHIVPYVHASTRALTLLTLASAGDLYASKNSALVTRANDTVMIDATLTPTNPAIVALPDIARSGESVVADDQAARAALVVHASPDASDGSSSSFDVEEYALAQAQPVFVKSRHIPASLRASSSDSLRAALIYDPSGQGIWRIPREPGLAFHAIDAQGEYTASVSADLSATGLSANANAIGMWRMWDGVSTLGIWTSCDAAGFWHYSATLGSLQNGVPVLQAALDLLASEIPCTASAPAPQVDERVQVAVHRDGVMVKRPHRFVFSGRGDYESASRVSWLALRYGARASFAEADAVTRDWIVDQEADGFSLHHAATLGRDVFFTREHASGLMSASGWIFSLAASDASRWAQVEVELPFTPTQRQHGVLGSRRGKHLLGTRLPTTLPVGATLFSWDGRSLRPNAPLSIADGALAMDAWSGGEAFFVRTQTSVLMVK